MSEAIQAYPLQWPAGWRRTTDQSRMTARFNKKVPQYRTDIDPNTGLSRTVRLYDRSSELSMQDATTRVLDELMRMGMERDDIVISTNVELRLDGLPRSNRRAPDDPGAAVYWAWRKGKGKESRCMAVDQYDRVEDNLSAIAATLDAMRAIERHGGAAILDRAFQGFTAIAAPVAWWQVLGLEGPNATREEIELAYRRKAMQNHPDRKPEGEQLAAAELMMKINTARDQGLATL